MVVYSLFGCGLFFRRQDKVGEVLEHPVVLQGVVNDAQEFACQGDVGLVAAAPALNACDASVAGLTNLLYEVQRPHTTNAARNLPAPQLLPWNLSPQKLNALFMPFPL